MNYNVLTHIRRLGYSSVSQYQRHNARALNVLSQLANGRDALIDGVYGPCMIEDVAGRNCDCPDFNGHHVIADARWPPGCTDIPIYLDLENLPTDMRLTRQEIVKTFTWAADTWNRAADLTLYLTNDRTKAACLVRFEPQTGSTLAWSSLANNTCSQDKQQRYDIRAWSLQTFRQTVLHELGHLIGLNHMRGDYVMNPTILTQIYGLTPTDKLRAVNLGYGAPLEPPTPKPTPPIPTPEPPPKDENPMNLLTIIATLLKMFQSCTPAARESAQRPQGRLGRRLALRRAALESGADWNKLRKTGEARDFIELGFTDADAIIAQQVLHEAEEQGEEF